jgi:hypothetical protein
MKTGADKKSVSLFVPGVHLHDARQIRKLLGQQQPLGSLELLYSRASFHRGNCKSPEHALFELFNLRSSKATELPVGALTRYLVKGDDANKCWTMRADPVFIQPNRDHLVLMGNAGLELGYDQAQQIINDINETYTDTPWELVALTPKQWVIEQQQPEKLKTHRLPDVVGKNISEYLPQGINEKKWHALMNELQMILHAHPVNQQRQMQGLPVVNSLWFWGAGELPVVSLDDDQRAFAQCWSNETVSLALARLNNVPRTNLPANGDIWLKQAITPGHHLLVIELLDSDQVKNDPLDWWQSLVEFDQQWLSPLITAVKQNAIDQLQVIDVDGSRYQLTRNQARRWWKLSSRI